MRALSDKQKEAIEKLHRLKVGALFLGCGCGKTQAAVELINTVEDIDLLMFVCPCRTKDNLREELAKCGCRYEADIVGVESIGCSDRIYLEVLDKVQSARKVFLVIDESIKVKNWSAKRTRRLIGIGEHAEFKLILNGTPITKNIIDIWAQMNFLSPKILGNISLYKFRDRYCKYTQVMQGYRVKKTFITGYENIDHLLSIIDPYVYQCDLDLNLSKFYHSVPWKMTDEEANEYENLKVELSEGFANDEESILAVLSKLQHSYCLSQAKFEAIKDLINDKTLIMCKYIASREALMSSFPNARIMTYGTGSFGLNLQQYNRIVYFDKTWDYAFREQSEARIYRMGQQEDCEYFDLTGDIGLEYMIDRCINKKTNLVQHFKTTMPKIKDL